MEANWKEAPGWAHWYAIDNDGERAWFELEPKPGENFWMLHDKVGQAQRIYPQYIPSSSNWNWKGTLEERPKYVPLKLRESKNESLFPRASLRDQFAMVALKELLKYQLKENSDIEFNSIAINSYNMSEAMLKAREQNYEE